MSLKTGTESLNDVPIQSVSGLAIWGLSDSSYPYLGYMVVTMKFPTNVTAVPEAISVLALICQGLKTEDETDSGNKCKSVQMAGICVQGDNRCGTVPDSWSQGKLFDGAAQTVYNIRG